MQISFQSRINPISIAAGVIVTLAFLFFFMSMASAMGLWSFRAEELPFLGMRVWKTAAGLWALSTFFGAFLAVLASGSTELKNSWINATTTWAASFLFFGGLSQSMADASLHPTVEIFKLGFAGDAASLIAANIGGSLAVWIERAAQAPRKVHEKPAQQKTHLPLNVALEGPQKGFV